MPSCPSCGAEIHYVEQYGQWYCFSCRQYFMAQTVPQCPQAPPPPVQPYPPAQQYPSQAYPQQPAYYPQQQQGLHAPPPKKEEKKRKWAVLFVIIIALLILLPALFIYFRWHGLPGTWSLGGGNQETFIFYVDGQKVDYSTACSGCWVTNNPSTTYPQYTWIDGYPQGAYWPNIKITIPTNGIGSWQSPNGHGQIVYTVSQSSGGGSGYYGDDYTYQSNYSITVTKYGAVGDYIEGTFHGRVFNPSESNSYEITNGYFKVIRDKDIDYGLTSH